MKMSSEGFRKVQKMSSLRTLIIVVLIFPFISCSSFQRKIQNSQRLLRQGQYDQAIKILKPLAEKEGKDQLVYLLEYGTALQLAGRYKQSNKVFLAADSMSEVKDYVSLSKETASLLLNEGMTQYKGEDFEKVLINVMLAINYVMLSELDDALVEVRRINEKLYHYKTEAKRNYEQNPFAFYLSAMLWEDDRKWDDAYIDYEKVHKLSPGIPYLESDLIRAAKQAQRPEKLKKWQAEFGRTASVRAKNRGTGELVLIYQQGMGPIKKPNPSWHRVPKLFRRWSRTRQARLIVEGRETELSQIVYDLESVAIKSLDDAYSGLIAKRMAGVVAKEVLADQVKQKNELLGVIMQIGMHVMDQADLRQWSLLPKTIQVAKLNLKPGTYRVRVEGLDGEGTLTGEHLEFREITIRLNKKTYFNWRSFD